MTFPLVGAASPPGTLPGPSSSGTTFGAGWGHFLLEIRPAGLPGCCLQGQLWIWSLLLWAQRCWNFSDNKFAPRS